MTRDDDIRRREQKRRDSARESDKRKREKNAEWQDRLQKRRQQEKSARTTQEPLKRREAVKTKPRPRIKAKTTKRAGQEREYSQLRKEYLERNPECHGCIERKRSVRNPAVQIHHTAGRLGEMLNNVKFWMAVCEECHTWIHAHPVTSHRKAWLVSRMLAGEQMLITLKSRRGHWPHVKRELEGME